MSKSNLLALLHRVNQIAAERFAATVGDSSITVRQVQILAAISANPGAAQTDLVDATGIDRSTMADIMRRLSQRKWIERQRTKRDQRAYSVRLTDTGRRELAARLPALEMAEKSLLVGLGPQQKTELLALLERMVATA